MAGPRSNLVRPVLCAVCGKPLVDEGLSANKRGYGDRAAFPSDQNHKVLSPA